MELASAAAAVQGDSKLGLQQLHSREPREGDNKEYQNLVHGGGDDGDDDATFSQYKQDPILLSSEQKGSGYARLLLLWPKYEELVL
jgi:hypothetical protein